MDNWERCDCQLGGETKDGGAYSVTVCVYGPLAVPIGLEVPAHDVLAGIKPFWEAVSPPYSAADVRVKEI